MIKIKMYRQTIRHTEHLPPHLGDEPIISYHQTNWSCCSTMVPGRDRAIVKTEEKEVEVSETCLRRKK